MKLHTFLLLVLAALILLWFTVTHHRTSDRLGLEVVKEKDIERDHVSFVVKNAKHVDEFQGIIKKGESKKGVEQEPKNAKEYRISYISLPSGYTVKTPGHFIYKDKATNRISMYNTTNGTYVTLSKEESENLISHLHLN
ncbi:hypothetical protein CN918_28950 [Priestia megaterium]|nr:hypothetical protein CN918_28950 [Priestia megaterium]